MRVATRNFPPIRRQFCHTPKRRKRGRLVPSPWQMGRREGNLTNFVGVARCCRNTVPHADLQHARPAGTPDFLRRARQVPGQRPGSEVTRNGRIMLDVRCTLFSSAPETEQRNCENRRVRRRGQDGRCRALGRPLRKPHENALRRTLADAKPRPCRATRTRPQFPLK